MIDCKQELADWLKAQPPKAVVYPDMSGRFTLEELRAFETELRAISADDSITT